MTVPGGAFEEVAVDAAAYVVEVEEAAAMIAALRSNPHSAKWTDPPWP